MKKRVLSIAMFCVVAVVSFYIGTTASGLKAAPPTPPSAVNSLGQPVGAVVINGTAYAVFSDGTNAYGLRVRTN